MQLEIFAGHHIADMLDWFPTAEALIQWGGPGLRFPLDETQLEEMQASTSGDAPTRWMFAGIVDGNLAGHAQVALDWENGVGRLSRVAINPRFRGQGLAHPFLQRVIARFFADARFERLELQRLYVQHGRNPHLSEARLYRGRRSAVVGQGWRYQVGHRHLRHAAQRSRGEQPGLERQPDIIFGKRCRGGARMGEIVELRLLDLLVEIAGIRKTVKHRGHPPGKAHRLPHSR